MDEPPQEPAAEPAVDEAAPGRDMEETLPYEEAEEAEPAEEQHEEAENPEGAEGGSRELVPPLPFSQAQEVMWEEEDRYRRLQEVVEGRPRRYNPRYKRPPVKLGDYIW